MAVGILSIATAFGVRAIVNVYRYIRAQAAACSQDLGESMSREKKLIEGYKDALT